MVINEGSVAGNGNKWIEQRGCDKNVLSTYFPESFQQGGVEGTLGELCNGTIKTLSSMLTLHV